MSAHMLFTLNFHSHHIFSGTSHNCPVLASNTMLYSCSTTGVCSAHNTMYTFYCSICNKPSAVIFKIVLCVFFLNWKYSWIRINDNILFVFFLLFAIAFLVLPLPQLVVQLCFCCCCFPNMSIRAAFSGSTCIGLNEILFK